MLRNRDGGENPAQQGAEQTDPQVEQTDQTDQANQTDPTPDAGQEKPQDKPSKAENQTPPASGEKVRIKCTALAGKELIVGTETIQTDNEGAFEVDSAQAAVLLTIPGYEKV